MTTYCEYCITHPEDTFNKAYHDTQYGFPLKEDDLLFERLVLEINQAGLSWITILKKAGNFRCAYDGFKIAKVAGYTEKDRARLLADAGIIRNHLKINAAIHNAQRIQDLHKEYGSFKGWLDAHHPRSLAAWTKLFKQTFIFTGGEIVREFLLSTGYLPGAHEEDCPVYGRILRRKPAWTRGRKK
jgi:DNA-3-methyladenine glycosylase I